MSDIARDWQIAYLERVATKRSEEIGLSGEDINVNFPDVVFDLDLKVGRRRTKGLRSETATYHQL